MAFSKTELLKKVAALNIYLLWKSNCWGSCFSENKAVLKKSLNMREGKSPFEKKKSGIELVVTFNWNYFPQEVPSPW